MNGVNFPPIQSSTASGLRQIISWDATPVDTCITPKIGAPAIPRPNGSSEGRRILSRQIDGTGYGLVGAPGCSGVKNVAGLADYARSSSGPSSTDTGTALTYIPFGRDGVSFGYYRASGGPAVTQLTRAQLTTLFTTGPQVINGVNIIPCGIQTGSGTYSFWNTVTTASCHPGEHRHGDLPGPRRPGPAPGERRRRADGQGQRRPGGLARSSSGSRPRTSSRSRTGRPPTCSAPPRSGRSPTTARAPRWEARSSGTAPNLTPNATFYNDTVFGRNVFNVLDSAKVDNIGNNDLKTLFVGPTSAMCSAAAQAIVNSFGFSTPTNCGVTTIRGSLVSGQD